MDHGLIAHGTKHFAIHLYKMILVILYASICNCFEGFSQPSIKHMSTLS